MVEKNLQSITDDLMAYGPDDLCNVMTEVMDRQLDYVRKQARDTAETWSEIADAQGAINELRFADAADLLKTLLSRIEAACEAFDDER